MKRANMYKVCILMLGILALSACGASTNTTPSAAAVTNTPVNTQIVPTATATSIPLPAAPSGYQWFTSPKYGFSVLVPSPLGSPNTQELQPMEETFWQSLTPSTPAYWYIIRVDIAANTQYFSGTACPSAPNLTVGSGIPGYETYATPIPPGSSGGASPNVDILRVDFISQGVEVDIALSVVGNIPEAQFKASYLSIFQTMVQSFIPGFYKGTLTNPPKNC